MMKQLLVATAMLISMGACNSPEGSTNTEGSGASILPEKTGDTMQTPPGNSGGGRYSTDTMPGTDNTTLVDSTPALSTADSSAIRAYSDKRKQKADTNLTKKKRTNR